MSSEAWVRLQALFDVAISLEPAERADYLSRECGDDTELRRRIDSLIDADDAGGRIDDIVGRAATALASSVTAGQRVGPWELIEEIGRGGMGAVFLARRGDGEYDARAAIKLIGGIRTSEHLRRFRAERQILAGLDHPHIARLLDGGSTDEGVPWVAMELVDGVAVDRDGKPSGHSAEPITRYCDARGYDLERRLRLFRQVLSAVQHAHQKAIVHRDLKPSNVLVTEADGEPLPKVIDFGIAKIIASGEDTAGQTTHRAVLGTLEYMSPEQATGAHDNVDTRSDIYSLGVLLYELTTGTLPIPVETLRAASPAELERLLCNTEPPAPSRRVATTASDAALRHASERSTQPAHLARTLRGDLDNIVGMALRYDPAQRYASVAQFADDIDRYLAGYPVSAHPSTWWYRTRLFAGRHRAEVIAAGIALVILIGSTALFTIRLAAERDRALLEATKSAEIAGFLQEIFEVPDPASASGGDITARQLLDDGAERITSGLAGQPAVRASLLGVIGRTYRGLGLYSDAVRRLDESVTLRRSLGGEDDAETAALLHSLGRVRNEAGDAAGGEDALRAALALRVRLLGAEHTETASTRAALALNLRARGQYEEAESLARDAVRVHRRTLTAQDPELARSLHTLAYVLRSRRLHEESEALNREAVAIRRRILDPSHPDLLSSMANLALVLEARGTYAEAEALLVEVLERRRSRLGVEHPQTLVAHNNLAYMLWRTGQYARAEDTFREVLALGRRALGREHTTIAIMLNNLGVALRRAGALTDAEAAHREALAMNRRLLGEEHPRVAADMDNLGRVLLAGGDAGGAEDLHRAAFAMHTRLVGSDNPALAESLSGLAAVRAARGDTMQADSLLRDALRLRATRLGEENLRVAQLTFELGVLMRQMRRFDEANALLQRTLDVRRSLLDAGHPDIAVTLREIGVLLMETGRHAEAEARLLESRRIALARLGADDPDTRSIEQALRSLTARR
ncbi:MAG: serine/threonine protein kinase [Gemmatimonadetes bacterium]|nr:serine/threonine protein kinase [Gemmatimonadota bacterium]